MLISHKHFHHISLALLAIMAIVLAACTQAVPTVSKPKLSSDPVVRWIQQNAITLRTTNQGGSDADLAPLQQIVGQASLVGLGEGSHGSHENIDLKARIVEYLISHLGFTTFVMENDWGRSQLLDAYINGGPGSLTAVMSQSLFDSWQTQEYQTLFAWMRSYNADSTHTTKIHFLGMDCQDVSQNEFDAVEQYVRTVVPDQAASVENLYAPIIANTLQHGDSYPALSASTKQLYQNQAQQVYNLLQAHQQDFTARSSAQRFALALQNARILVQFTTYSNATTQSEYMAEYYQRDTFMAENVAWIHDHDAGSNPKIIIWAHDLHIANNTFYGSQDGRNMGAELRALYHEHYLPIGTSLYQGAARFWQGPLDDPDAGFVRSIPLPETDTYNYTLGQAGLPLYLLDLRNLPAGPIADWAEGSGSYFTSYGGGDQNNTDLCVLNQWFDVIINIQNTTPSQPL